MDFGSSCEETEQLQIYGRKGVKNLTKQFVYVPAYWQNKGYFICQEMGIKNGTKTVRPIIIMVLILLFLKTMNGMCKD